MAAPTDVVVAGTKAFALALFAPLTERLGTRPRIAPEPQQALALCAGSSGVLVVEYGAAWLGVLQQLRQQAPGLRVVAALPRGEEAAALTLAPLGVEAIPWDGQPAPVLVAVSGLMGGVLGGAPPTVAPAAPRPATAPAAGAPPPRLSPPAPPQVRAVAAPPAGRPVAPAAQPGPGSGSLPDDLFSGFEQIESAAAVAVAVAAPAVSRGAVAPERAAPPPYTGPAAAPAASAAPVASAAPPAGPDWPASAPTEDEAESALVLHARGKLRPEAPLAAPTRQAVAAMSELERQVLGGAPLPFDGQPIYRAAVLRLRVAVALSTVPVTPARVDDAAVQRLLAEFDALLAQVNPLAKSAPPEHQAALEAVRNALVSEAVDFSEATHRVIAGGPPPAQEPSSRPAPRGPAAGARVLSVQAGEAREAPEERRRRGPVVLLVVVVLLGAGYHAWNYLSRPAPVPAVTYQGAPAGTRAVTTAGGRFLLALAGQRVDPAELERFRRQEEKKGNTVREVAPGRWIIEPAAPAAKEKTP